jgi:hypothetical protein
MHMVLGCLQGDLSAWPQWTYSGILSESALPYQAQPVPRGRHGSAYLNIALGPAQACYHGYHYWGGTES